MFIQNRYIARIRDQLLTALTGQPVKQKACGAVLRFIIADHGIEFIDIGIRSILDCVIGRRDSVNREELQSRHGIHISGIEINRISDCISLIIVGRNRVQKFAHGTDIMIGRRLCHGDSVHYEFLHQGLAAGVLLSLESDDFFIISSQFLPVGSFTAINSLNLLFCKALYRVGRIDHEDQGIHAYGLHLKTGFFFHFFSGLFRGLIGKEQVAGAAGKLMVREICLIVLDSFHGSLLVFSGGCLEEGIGEREGRS